MSGATRAPHLSRRVVSQSETTSRKPRRQGLYEHTRNELGFRRNRRRWKARAGEHRVVERGSAGLAGGTLAGRGNGPIGKNHGQRRSFSAGHPEIFAIGDTAHVVAPSRNLLGVKSKEPMTMPGVAQPAIQEGQYVAQLIRQRLAGKPDPAPFWYWDKGDLAIVGRTYAVADLRFVRFSGFLAWLLWAAVHIYFLIGFANRFFVILQWGVAFLTKQRQVRVFPGQERGANAP